MSEFMASKRNRPVGDVSICILVDTKGHAKGVHRYLSKGTRNGQIYTPPVSSAIFCSKVISVPNTMTETVPGERRVTMSLFQAKCHLFTSYTFSIYILHILLFCHDQDSDPALPS